MTGDAVDEFANLFAQENLSFKNVYTSDYMERKTIVAQKVEVPRDAASGELALISKHAD